MYFSDAEREALKRLIKIGQAITYAPDQHLQAGSFLQALAFVSHLREVGRLAEVFEPASVPAEGRPRLRQNIAETIQKLTVVQRRI